MATQKTFELSDGSVWTAGGVARETGLSISTIRNRLYRTDDIIGTLREEDRVTAYTAMYVLYNSVVKEANKGVVHVVPARLADNW